MLKFQVSSNWPDNWPKIHKFREDINNLKSQFLLTIHWLLKLLASPLLIVSFEHQLDCWILSSCAEYRLSTMIPAMTTQRISTLLTIILYLWFVVCGPWLLNFWSFICLGVSTFSRLSYYWLIIRTHKLILWAFLISSVTRCMYGWRALTLKGYKQKTRGHTGNLQNKDSISKSLNENELISFDCRQTFKWVLAVTIPKEWL